MAAEQQLTSLEADCDSAFKFVRSEMAQIKSGNPRGNNANANNIVDVEKKILTMEQAMTSFTSGAGTDNIGVRAGKYYFQSIEDLGAWIDKYMPPNCHFGVFCDAYSFLERVKSSRDVGGGHNVMADMETRRKLSLSADEAMVIESFQSPLSRCFRGSSSSSGLSAWLPGLRTKDAWLNKVGTCVVRLVIQDNTEGIHTRIASLIDTRYGNKYPEAAALAHRLLSFITSLCSFITDTQKKLEDVGYLEESAWSLFRRLSIVFLLPIVITLRKGVLRSKT